MSNRFHLALEAGNLEKTLPFYTDILGCTLDMKEEGRWQDVDFWGNELTLHQSIPRSYPERTRHNVDMGAVYVPHFGVHLPFNQFNEIKKKVQESVGFLDEPYIRFKDTVYQQETFFVEDPNFNVLEIKSMNYVDLPKQVMCNLIQELMIDQRLDPQDFQEISLKYATDEELMAYSEHWKFHGDFEDLENPYSASERREALIEDLYGGGYDYDSLTSLPIIFQYWEKEKIIEFCKKENILYIFSRNFLCNNHNYLRVEEMTVLKNLDCSSCEGNEEE